MSKDLAAPAPSQHREYPDGDRERGEGITDTDSNRPIVVASRPSWAILRDEETEAVYATNGLINLAIEFHPHNLVKFMASHSLLLQHRDEYAESFVNLAQRFLASGAGEYPNQSSVAFLQALEYSLLRLMWLHYSGQFI